MATDKDTIVSYNQYTKKWEVEKVGKSDKNTFLMGHSKNKKDKTLQKYSVKKNRYSKIREGNSHFFDILCSACGNYIALYQKDGTGRLLRMYIDRILAPTALTTLKFKDSKKDLQNLQCSCGSLMGVPMVHKSENRLAFRLIYGSFIKKNSSGTHMSLK